MEQENVHLRGQLDAQAARRVAAACITEGGQAGSLVERAASKLSDSQAEVGLPQTLRLFLLVTVWLCLAASSLSESQVEVGLQQTPCGSAGCFQAVEPQAEVGLPPRGERPPSHPLV